MNEFIPKSFSLAEHKDEISSIDDITKQTISTKDTKLHAIDKNILLFPSCLFVSFVDNSLTG